MKLYFIRHGDPDYSHDCLTDLGKEQAKKLASRLSTWNFDNIFVSTMGRAQETASYTEKVLNKKAVTVEWLREIEWGNKSGDAFATESPWSINDKFIKENHAYPAGDSWKDLDELSNDRLVPDYDERLRLFEDFLKNEEVERKNQLFKINSKNCKNIAFFCHGGISAAFISYLINVPFFQFNAHIGLNVTSVTCIEINGEPGEFVSAKLKFLNDFTHL